MMMMIIVMMIIFMIIIMVITKHDDIIFISQLVNLKDSKPKNDITAAGNKNSASNSRKEEQAKQLADKMV